MAKKSGKSVISKGLRSQPAAPAGRPFQDELRHNRQALPHIMERDGGVTHHSGKKTRTTDNKQGGIPGGGTIPVPGKAGPGKIPQPKKGKS